MSLWSVVDLDCVIHETPRLQVVGFIGDPPRVALRIIALILFRHIGGDVSADWEFAGRGLRERFAS